MYTQAELSAMTVEDLKAIAKEKGVQGYSGMAKADLVTSILTVTTAPEIPTVVPAKETVAAQAVATETKENQPPTVSASDDEMAIRNNIRQALLDKVNAVDNVNIYPSPYGNL